MGNFGNKLFQVDRENFNQTKLTARLIGSFHETAHSICWFSHVAAQIHLNAPKLILSYQKVLTCFSFKFNLQISLYLKSTIYSAHNLHIFTFPLRVSKDQIKRF